MPTDLLESIRRQSSSSIQWSVVRCGSPLTRPGIATEKVLWRDPDGDMYTCYVGSKGDGFYRLSQGDDICVDFLRRCLEVRASDHVLAHTINHFIADQAIPRAMADEDMFILHAGAVCVGPEAVLFMGQSGRGKSTLVASFNTTGADFIGDDAMVISRRGPRHEVQSIYPSLRLFSDSLEAILPKGAVSHLVTQQSSKRRIDIPPASATASAPRPIAAVFTIAEPTNENDIIVRKLSVAETCMAAIENSFLLDPSDVSRARHQLFLASELARDVPAFEISYPRDYARLPEVRRLILSRISEFK